MRNIPYGHQDVNAADIAAVEAVLKSDWITQGPVAEQFEQAVADYCGARYAAAVNSETSALHIACLAAGLHAGDWLWTTPITFVASANCGLYCGAQVDFVDIDPRTYNMDVDSLAAKLAQAEKQGRLPKVVVPVHFSGQPCDMEPIHELAKRYGFLVIEDAAHAIGGSYKGTRIGACTYADMTVFSFHPVKIVTTAEGGMAVTNNQELYERLIRFRSHGITKDPRFMKGEPDGPWYYQQIDLGYNYRMTELQAALGVSQMKRIDAFVARRTALAERYDSLLAGLPVITPYQRPDVHSAWHIYVAKLDETRTAAKRREVFDAMRAAGIGVNVHYIPVHTQPYYQALGFRQGDFPQAEAYYRQTLTLPLFYGLTEDDQDYVVQALAEALR